MKPDKYTGAVPRKIWCDILDPEDNREPCGWWANHSGSWCRRGHLQSSGSWVSADRHSSGSGVDHASEMLFIWLTAEFICSIIYLISLTKKKNILFCHVFYFDSSDFLQFDSVQSQHGEIFANRNDTNGISSKTMIYGSRDICFSFSCQWDAEIKCLRYFRLCLSNLVKLWLVDS